MVAETVEEGWAEVVTEAAGLVVAGTKVAGSVGEDLAAASAATTVGDAEGT